jgi:hypothetical protein
MVMGRATARNTQIIKRRGIQREISALRTIAYGPRRLASSCTSTIGPNITVTRCGYRKRGRQRLDRRYGAHAPGDRRSWDVQAVTFRPRTNLPLVEGIRCRNVRQLKSNGRSKHRTLTPHGFNRTTGGGWDFALTAEFSKRKSADSTEEWQRPGFRGMRSAIAREIWQRPEFQAKRARPGRPVQTLRG